MSYYSVISCLLALTVSTKADALGGLVYAPGHSSVDYYAYPRYAFDYSVNDPHTGDNKAQWEKRDGDVVKGAYSLVEPDGSLRVVEYWADDKSGFNAVVKRYGPNLHPTPVSHAPIYKAPIPVLGHGAVGPYSIGPVAKLGGLATAPLLTGSLYGGATSSASLFKSPAPIVKTFVPSSPILPSPILSDPIIKSNPYIPPLPAPIIKSAPIWPAPLPLLKAPYDLSSLGGWGDSLVKNPLLHDYDIGHGLLPKGPVLPGWSIPLPYPSYNGYKDY